MKRIMKKQRGFCVVGIVLFALMRLVVAQTVEQQSKQTTVLPAIDLEKYKELMSDRMSDVFDLERWFIDHNSIGCRSFHRREDFILRQPSGQVLPFDWQTFPSELYNT